jgi:hypothetical protein
MARRFHPLMAITAVVRSTTFLRELLENAFVHLVQARASIPHWRTYHAGFAPVIAIPSAGHSEALRKLPAYSIRWPSGI